MLLQIYVIKFFIIFLNNLVLAIAGNKEDMYANEEVEEEEAKKLAEDLKAIFQKTSAKSANGVEDLFIKIGKKFLNPKEFDSSGQTGNSGKTGKNDKKESIKLNKKNSDGKPKKGCC